MASENMYLNTIRFRIVSTMTDLEFNKIIEEPLNIADSEYILQRDLEYYGFIAQYIDENAVIEFDNSADSGRAEIESVFLVHGCDAKVLFYIEIYEDGEWLEIIKANLNFNSFFRAKESVTCPIERVQFDSKFRTRFETTVKTSESLTLDGSVISPLVPNVITLHPQARLRYMTSNQPSNGASHAIGANYGIWIYGNNNNPINLFDDNSGIPSAYFTIGKNDNVYQKVANAGYANFKASRAGKLRMGMTSGGYKMSMYGNGTFNITRGIYYVIYTPAYIPGNDATIKYSGMLVGGNTVITITAAATKVLETYLGDYYFNDGMEISKGDYAVFFFAGKCVENGLSPVITQMNMSPKFSIIETGVTSSGQVRELKAVVTYNMKMITNSDNLKSDFLTNLDGRIVLANGNNLITKSSALLLKMKTLMDSLSCVWNLGYTITTDENGADCLIIEPFEHFFQNNKILTITEVYDYSERWDKDLMANYISIGYDKYIDSDKDAADCFNTIREYQLPIDSFSKSISKKCPITADGFLINKVRNYQFEDNFSYYSSNVISEAEDLFFLCLNAAKNSSKDDSPTGVTGVIDSRYVYNFRISPTRMMYNWQSFINSLLSYKANGSEINNRVCVNNKLAAGSLQGLINDSLNGIFITEGQNFLVSDTKKIFKPYLSVFKCPLTYTQFLTIKESLSNKGLNVNGYLEVYGIYGIVRIFAKKISYNPITQIAQIEGWQKY